MRSIRLAFVVVFGGLILSTSTWADGFACAAIDGRAARLQCFTAVEEIIATVGRVVDGDTLDICIGASCIRIRLCGINAPERSEPGGADATEGLRALVARETVLCVPVGQGTICGRALAGYESRAAGGAVLSRWCRDWHAIGRGSRAGTTGA